MSTKAKWWQGQLLTVKWKILSMCQVKMCQPLSPIPPPPFLDTDSCDWKYFSGPWISKR